MDSSISFKSLPAVTSKSVSKVEAREPCPGITSAVAPIDVYIKRSADTGGGCDVQDIAREMYGKKTKYKALWDTQKKIVLTAQQRKHTWTNDHVMSHIFATDCRKTGGPSPQTGRQ